MSDKELILGCLDHDSKSQKALFDKYSGVMMTVCRRYFRDLNMAQDAMQEGFIRVYGNLHQFKFDGSFEGWMKRIMVNVSLRKLKKETKYLEMGELEKTNEKIQPQIHAKINEEDLLKMIAELPTGYRTVFNMYAIDGYSHKEIAKQLEITDSTSRSQLVKARKMLQKMLNRLDEK